MTNQEDIVLHAKYCCDKFPTIVNNIPKEKNTYTNEIVNFAKIDNSLSAYQRIIGESSNLAQICLTYTYNFNDAKYTDYACILAVLAQIAIDSAKRKFDIDLQNELRRIKLDMETGKNGYPEFWAIIRRGFNSKRINHDLVCPMNSLCSIERLHYRDSEKSIPISEFFVKTDIGKSGQDRLKAKRVEDMIQKYSLKLANLNNDNDDNDEFLLLYTLFDELVEDLKTITVTKGVESLMSWLLNRAFCIGAGAKRNKVSKTKSQTEKNKSLLTSVLYNMNKDAFLKCFKQK